MSELNIIDVLRQIQAELKAPKGNSGRGYSYRNAEDILHALKDLLVKHNAVVLLSDEVIEIGGKVFIKTTATLKVGVQEISTTGNAEHGKMKLNLDDAQISGATTSYARKYALGGLFAIDDGKDVDQINNQPGQQVTAGTPVSFQPAQPPQAVTPIQTQQPTQQFQFKQG